jgi:hypothetical protein
MILESFVLMREGGVEERISIEPDPPHSPITNIPFSTEMMLLID